MKHILNWSVENLFSKTEIKIWQQAEKAMWSGVFMAVMILDHWVRTPCDLVLESIASIFMVYLPWIQSQQVLPKHWLTISQATWCHNSKEGHYHFEVLYQSSSKYKRVLRLHEKTYIHGHIHTYLGTTGYLIF